MRWDGGVLLESRPLRVVLPWLPPIEGRHIVGIIGVACAMAQSCARCVHRSGFSLTAGEGQSYYVSLTLADEGVTR